MSWSRHFDDAISLPGGGVIETLREAGDYIIALPKREHGLPHWQTAIRCLLDAAEHGGIVMVADIAMRRALSHGQPRPAPAPRKKAATDHSTIETVDGDECSARGLSAVCGALIDHEFAVTTFDIKAALWAGNVELAKVLISKRMAL
jgi:hypothetical protein